MDLAIEKLERALSDPTGVYIGPGVDADTYLAGLRAHPKPGQSQSSAQGHFCCVACSDVPHHRAPLPLA